MPLIATYTYLSASLLLMGVFAIAYALKPEHRRVGLLSASLSAPYSLFAVVFVPAYWEPTQVFRFLVGPEDLLFSFATGGTVWILLAGSYYAIPDRLWGRACGARYALVTALFLAGWTVVGLLGLPIMWAALVAGVGLWCFLVCRDMAALAVSLKSAAAFTIGYTLFVATVLYFSPASALSWTAGGLVGITILGVPLEETLWAVEFGAVWPLLIAYILDIAPRRPVGEQAVAA